MLLSKKTGAFFSISVLVASFLLTGCSTHRPISTSEKNSSQTKQEPKKITKEKRAYILKDLQEIPQESSFYTKDLSIEKSFDDNYFKKHYRIWNSKDLSASIYEAMWQYRSYTTHNSYGVNLQKLEQNFFDEMLALSNFDAYGSLKKRAITLCAVDLRLFPTNQPLFRDPSKAGEGFPFDYLQNSSLFANEPLLVSHYSADKKWLFVESNIAFGWVLAKDVKFISDEESQLLQNSEHVFITQDKTPLYDEAGEFLFYGRIGMSFALADEQNESFKLYAPSSSKDVKSSFTLIQKSHAHRGFLKFNAKNIEKILTQIQSAKYGWGGAYGEKDCSSTLRDFYAPFGLWLPRNSSMQAQKGHKILLKNLTPQEKLEKIRENGVAFLTLLFKPGHIVMYVGEYEGKAVIFQNIWGVKTLEDEKEGRFVVGKAVFSTQELGKELENYASKSSLLETITSMNLLLK